MSVAVTIDASVFVSAFSPAEPAHPASKALMTRIRDNSISIVVPTLVLPEVSAAISRGQGKPELGVAFAGELRRLPHLSLVSVDESLADLAVEIAAQRRLRASDAVYAAVALRFGTELITLDREQLERLPEVLPVRSP